MISTTQVELQPDGGPPAPGCFIMKPAGRRRPLAPSRSGFSSLAAIAEGSPAAMVASRIVQQQQRVRAHSAGAIAAREPDLVHCRCRDRRCHPRASPRARHAPRRAAASSGSASPGSLPFSFSRMRWRSSSSSGLGLLACRPRPLGQRPRRWRRYQSRSPRLSAVIDLPRPWPRNSRYADLQPAELSSP